MNVNLSSLATEQMNEKTKNIDQLSTKEMTKLMNQEDQKVAKAVGDTLPEVNVVIDAVFQSLKAGGRLFYVGAGTSGRLGILDASECPPTFCTPAEMVQGIIAGGERAIQHSVESAEDSDVLARENLKSHQLDKKDIIIGIAASGRTPYVIGALQYAKEVGAKAVALACNQQSEIGKHADYKIEVVVGPEVVSGSTRLKAGTAQKLILNMISTITMIKLGKVYGNLMVDLDASNAKLIERARKILIQATGISYEEAVHTLNQTDQKVKPAIVMILAGVDFAKAEQALKGAEGFVRTALQALQNKEGTNEA